MQIGEWLKSYRIQHKLTMQDMANLCGFSKSYVNMLEKGINPTTNKPVSPTMQIFEKIARATGQDIDSLLKLLDDEQLVTINTSNAKISAEESKLLADYRDLNSFNKQQITNIISAFLAQQAATNYVATV